MEKVDQLEGLEKLNEDIMRALILDVIPEMKTVRTLTQVTKRLRSVDTERLFARQDEKEIPAAAKMRDRYPPEQVIIKANILFIHCTGPAILNNAIDFELEAVFTELIGVRTVLIHGNHWQSETLIPLLAKIPKLEDVSWFNAAFQDANIKPLTGLKRLYFQYKEDDGHYLSPHPDYPQLQLQRGENVLRQIIASSQTLLSISLDGVLLPHCHRINDRGTTFSNLTAFTLVDPIRVPRDQEQDAFFFSKPAKLFWIAPGLEHLTFRHSDSQYLIMPPDKFKSAVDRSTIPNLASLTVHNVADTDDDLFLSSLPRTIRFLSLPMDTYPEQLRDLSRYVWRGTLPSLKMEDVL
ncbi:hypothetical protein M422DRAFT_783059 [Sphaerobolus stellatus SS14]|uniref:Uncharacterized protein n=1 Tax=Sphaerobolus stellatus (strain SS14) TaxID=990650 RepID=A0A0C9UGG7_SPHS4|nr:hypothetical protein M422DRAFT_783059 [Sphaerobolus stellatus SS14]